MTKAESEVLEGRNGNLFLIKSVHNILKHITGKIIVDENFKKNFQQNILARAEYCLDRNIQYKHFIYPDKISVLIDDFPIDDTISFSEMYKPFFTGDVVDLKDCLVGEDATKYFFKTDTHLSFDGKVKTSMEILSYFFNFDSVEIEKKFNSFRGGEKEMLGDLGGKLDPKIYEKRYDIITKFLKRFNNQVGANDGLVIVCLNKDMLRNKEHKKLLIFGDSFCERTLPLLSYFYSEVLFCRSRYFHKEIVEMFEPDHLITESAERYFSSVRLDEEAPRFNLVYGLKGAKYSESTDFYRAYNAVLNPKSPQYTRFMSKFIKSLWQR